MDAATEPRDASMTVRDGRTVAWTDWGDADGIPVLRVPGTPGCRWSVRVDRTPWAERGLRVVTTERPGFGASSRLPGRRFREHADDLAEVLDHLGLDRVHLTGGSGAAPHELALCQYHPDRVRAATVVAGIAPFRDDEIDTMIPINAQVARLARVGRRDEVAAVHGTAPRRHARRPAGRVPQHHGHRARRGPRGDGGPGVAGGLRTGPARVAGCGPRRLGRRGAWRWTASGTSTRHPCRRR